MHEEYNGGGGMHIMVLCDRTPPPHKLHTHHA
jgi:hypothetical protein